MRNDLAVLNHQSILTPEMKALIASVPEDPKAADGIPMERTKANAMLKANPTPEMQQFYDTTYPDGPRAADIIAGGG